MSVMKGVMLAGLIGAAAAGGYCVSNWQNSTAGYSIVKQEGKIMLYSRSSASYHEIQNIAGNIVVGSAKDNLAGYDVLRTKEIAEIVIMQYLGQTNQSIVPQQNSKKQEPADGNLEDALKKAFQR